MPYEPVAHRLHRMPVHFGPSPGPRESARGGRHEPDTTRETLRAGVAFRTDSAALDAILPVGFTPAAGGIARLEAACMTGIPWLAGRGYNTLSLIIPASYSGGETVDGDFVAVVFENLADPIITGREDLGWNKVYAELSLERDIDRVRCRASWLGFTFAELSVSGLRPVESFDPPAPRPRLNYKYIPATGQWGAPEVAYATVAPPPIDGGRTVELWHGTPELRIGTARWEDLPTLFRIVNGIASLPVHEFVGASVSRSIGADDLWDTRRLA